MHIVDYNIGLNKRFRRWIYNTKPNLYGAPTVLKRALKHLWSIMPCFTIPLHFMFPHPWNYSVILFHNPSKKAVAFDAYWADVHGLSIPNDNTNLTYLWLIWHIYGNKDKKKYQFRKECYYRKTYSQLNSVIGGI